MRTVVRKSWSELTRIDGRSATARRIKAVARQLKGQIGLPRRWSHAETDELHRVATDVVLAEEARRKALEGSVAFTDAVKAAGHARRAVRDLKAMVVPREELEPSYDELMGAL